jgi:hypothetical protein
MFDLQMRNMLPNLYHNIFSEKILNLSIREKTANCNSCVMATKIKPGSEKASYRNLKAIYKPNLKCCTFHPFFPNYIVGALLQDRGVKNSVGRQIMRERILNKKELLPLGVPAPRNYQLDFLENENVFGQRKSLLCPFYDQEKNSCGLWLYRGSVCTSYFCASDHLNGLDFWDDFGKYYSLIEMTLAEIVLEKMGLTAKETMAGFELVDLKKIKSAQRKIQSSKELTKVKRNQFWHKFESPEKFYLECHDQAQRISRRQLQKNLGEILRNQEQRVLSNYQTEKQR